MHIYIYFIVLLEFFYGGCNSIKVVKVVLRAAS